jgi:hypothetical protein
MRPHYGAVIFKDDFSNKAKWNNGKLPGGLVAFGKNELALAVRQERAYLTTLRSEPVQGDFYLEVNAAPSICRGADEYGVLFRFGSAGDLFRFGLTCNGKARVDRILGGQASSPQPPSAFGVVPPGAPSRSRLGVWAAAGTMHFYANNEYLFTVRDASLGPGGFGLYARASGPDELTVAFSDLVVYQAAK